MTPLRTATITQWLRRTALWIPAGIITLLMSPLVLTRRTFGPDWTLHLWAIQQQLWNVRAMGHPGLFVSASPMGAFYPLFAYVGSGVYTLGAYIALVTGSILAYKLLYLAGLCMAYTGCTWLARQFGVEGWQAQIPGAVFVTGAYFVTDMVGRGDFAEFVALASIPLILASARAVIVNTPSRARDRLALLGGVFVFTGSHNITLLWGTTFIVIIAAVGAIAWWPLRSRRSHARRVLQACGVVLVGAGLNAWYLLPDAAYSLDTRIAATVRSERPTTYHVHPAGLLNPFRPGDPHVPFWGRDIRLSLPLLFMAWVLLAAALLWRYRSGMLTKLFVGLCVVCAVFTTLIVEPPIWSALPHVYWSAQFTYRMDGYVLLGTALLVLVMLVWSSHARPTVARPLRSTLAVLVLFSAVVATWQVWAERPFYVDATHHFHQLPADSNFAATVVASRYTTTPSWYSLGDFVDIKSPIVPVAPGRTLTVPLDQVRGSTFNGTVDVPSGPAPFATNLAAGPQFVQLAGLEAIGRDAAGFVVARRSPDGPGSGAIPISVRTAHTAPVRLGAIISLLSLIALLALVLQPIFALLRSGRHRRALERQSQSHDEYLIEGYNS